MNESKNMLATDWQQMHLKLWNSFNTDSLYNVMPVQNRNFYYEVIIENDKYITICIHCDEIVVDETHKGMIEH